jgi:hypothetical protein
MLHVDHRGLGPVHRRCLPVRRGVERGAGAGRCPCYPAPLSCVLHNCTVHKKTLHSCFLKNANSVCTKVFLFSAVLSTVFVPHNSVIICCWSTDLQARVRSERNDNSLPGRPQWHTGCWLGRFPLMAVLKMILRNFWAHSHPQAASFICKITKGIQFWGLFQLNT